MNISTASTPLLRVRDLEVAYSDLRHKDHTVLHRISFDVKSGETVALVGESGSGKSTTAQAIMGLLPRNGRISGGAICLNGTDIARWSDKRLDSIRGKQISLIPQDPASSLNPVRTIGAQIGEVFRLHGIKDKREIQGRVIDLLAKVGLSQPQLRAQQYPHELSGGMRQRVLIAIAIALQPQLIIADEPTSALDVTVQRRILDLIDVLRHEIGTAVLLVTHDLNVAADRSDQVIVMRNGEIQEAGLSTQILNNPKNAYTKRLLTDAPSLVPANPRPRRPQTATPDIAVDVSHLVQDFALDGGGTFRAVDDVSFQVERGTTHALVGESGSGKTTTARQIMGLGQLTSGRVTVCGQNLFDMSRANLQAHRRRVQMIYQSPYNSIDPKQTVFRVIEEPLLNFEHVPPRERRERVEEMIDRVQLPRNVLLTTARNLSGGQRQRVAIARALILRPEILILDEAVSALDVTVQAQIIALLDMLQKQLSLTYIFVSHDLSVVRQIADTVSVLRLGKQVDFGPVERIFNEPQSEYTRDLLLSIPGQGRTKNHHHAPLADLAL